MAKPAALAYSLRTMKLYRFSYSPYARKVQMLLDLSGAKYQLVDVDYVDREELARITGGYIYVPVLVTDQGQVITESRAICEHWVATEQGRRLVPSPWEGPIWAYSDFTDGALEDVLFRIASPAVRDAWPSAFARALYVLIKERKFGAGCVDARARPADRARAQATRPEPSNLERAPILVRRAPHPGRRRPVRAVRHARGWQRAAPGCSRAGAHELRAKSRGRSGHLEIGGAANGPLIASHGCCTMCGTYANHVDGLA